MVIGRPSMPSIHRLEVALLIRQDLGKGLLAGLDVLATIISRMALIRLGLEEHVLGAAQADALGAELHGLRGVAGVIGVGADAAACGRCRPTP